MFAITKSDVQRITVSSIGALILSAACVTSAIGPARAAEPNAPLTVGDWQSQVERRIDTRMHAPIAMGQQDVRGTAVIRARFDANGAFAGATLAKSSGSSAIDGSALRTANRVSYPTLPAGLRGKPQTVEVQLYYGIAGSQAEADQQKRQFEESARAGHRHENTQTAALPVG